jgi:hypothetical protein
MLHFNFENNFYLSPATCAVANLGDNRNCQFYGKTVNKRLQNGRLLVMILLLANYTIWFAFK